uniref:Arf-GAP with coiled-coil, ANK repeat and PH domain-containing protein n=1 Tax=Sus scrofa TaxID=9823 RepID=A0A8D0PDF7_PIG
PLSLFGTCLISAPFAWATIDEVETDVVEIEAKLDKLVKLCSSMIEAGKAYVTTNKLFVSGVRDLSQQCQGDAVISECLQRFGDSLQEMVSYHMILFDQAQRSVRQQLHNFIKEDVRKFKETKKQFDKVREDMELSLVRNAQAPRHRPHEVEEATGALTLTRKCFRHLALDYVLQINVLQAKKKFEILDSMLSFMHAQYSFFQQGHSLLHQLDPYMKKLAAELDQLVIDSAVEKREMERKHAAIQQRVSPVAPASPLPPRGGCWVRGPQRRCLQDVLTVVVDDLRLCSVKPCEDTERRFCFEVVSPTKSCMLQADSEKLRQAWVQAVQASIASAYRESPDSCYSERLDRTASPSTSSIDSATDSRERSVKGESVLQRVQGVAGNSQCGDCGQPDPRWASINLGVLLCIECSGIHRWRGAGGQREGGGAPGRPLLCPLPAWPGSHPAAGSVEPRFRRDSLFCPDELDSLFSYFDAGAAAAGPRSLSSDSGLGGSSDGSSDVLAFGVGSVVGSVTEEEGAESEESSGEADGEAEAWGLADVRELHPGLLAHRAARTSDLPALAAALAHGAEVNWADAEDEGKTPLVQAVLGGSLIVCEFLLQNGADVNQRDSRVLGAPGGEGGLGGCGRGRPSRRASSRLRLARMAEEMREAEAPPGQPGPLAGSSPTELQYRRCIQDFISLHLGES